MSDTLVTGLIPRRVPGWHDQAACRDHPDLDWHSTRPADQAACRAVCSTCPVRLLCARDALGRGEPWGMWGGLTTPERRSIAARAGWPAPSVLPEHGTNSRYAKHRCGCPDCRRAHAVYEVERRAKARTKARRRAEWSGRLLVIATPPRGRRAPGPGQYVLPLPGLDAPREAVPAEPAPLPIAA